MWVSIHLEPAGAVCKPYHIVGQWRGISETITGAPCIRLSHWVCVEYPDVVDDDDFAAPIDAMLGMLWLQEAEA